MKKPLKQSFLHRIICFCTRYIGAFFVRCLMWTLRIDWGDLPYHSFRDCPPAIYALWHNRLLLLIGVGSQFSHRVCTLASQSKDGDIVASLLQQLGYHVVRGSSSRGGYQALRALIRQPKIPMSIALTVDGPKGPRYQIKDGIFYVAAKRQMPIIPITYCAKHVIRLSTWDHFMIPFPFTRIRLHFGVPFFVKEGMSLDEKEEYKRAILHELQTLPDTWNRGKINRNNNTKK